MRSASTVAALGFALALAGCSGTETGVAGSRALGEPCGATPDCDNGLTCYFDVGAGLCSKPCVHDADCGGNVTCILGRCFPGCTVQADCARTDFTCLPGTPSNYCGPAPLDLGAGA